MANIFDPTQEEKRLWYEWVTQRPATVQEAIGEHLNPWTLYRLKSTGQRVTMAAVSEDGTVRVDVTGQYNCLFMDRSVFGINPKDLEPCSLPGPNTRILGNPFDRGRS